jgi:hypothetical protein
MKEMVPKVALSQISRYGNDQESLGQKLTSLDCSENAGLVVVFEAIIPLLQITTWMPHMVLEHIQHSDDMSRTDDRLPSGNENRNFLTEMSRRRCTQASLPTVILEACKEVGESILSCNGCSMIR